jgi:aconitate hydratase
VATASPALVIAFAIQGSVMQDIERVPLGQDSEGRDVYLCDLWPDDTEVQALVREHVRPEFFIQRRSTVWAGTYHWQDLAAQGSERFEWEPRSTYLRRPQYTVDLQPVPDVRLDFNRARALAVFGDNITTDHISPAGTISMESVAGAWLLERGESPRDLNQYSTRRSNHEVMLRGAFTTPNLRNLLASDACRATGRTCLDSRPQPAVADLRRSADFCCSQHTADHLCRRQLRRRIEPRLGGSTCATGCSGRCGTDIRADTPQQPDWHGRVSAAVQDGDSAANCGLTGESIDASGLDGMVVGNNAVTLSITRADGTRRLLIVNLRVDSGQSFFT